MKHITKAWFINERTRDTWVQIGVQVGSKVHYGKISDAALVELALRACSTVQEAMNTELLQAVRAFVRQNKYATAPILTAPLDPLSDAKIQSPRRL
ncbi:hypothetical protein [Caballeronia sp. GAFFF2]|uniref:hypothetical protein n=1 Tax=Caballeronia sp. GAFFF2 TaxID=2921741 RepID=UPI0020290EEA|nr:hypothetical protein [Caballeronia sp. GAFFF2]